MKRTKVPVAFYGLQTLENYMLLKKSVNVEGFYGQK